MKRWMEYGERHPGRLLVVAGALVLFGEAIADGLVRMLLGI